ncbi:MAG: VCBS repeat-containing protein, partial [Deltaproteobacteria bacterium]
MKQARKRRDGADRKARTAAREGKKRRFFTRGSLAPLAFLLCALLAAGNGEGEDWHAEKIEEELASHLSELCRHTAETKEMARTWAPLLAEDFSGMPLWGEGERIFGNEAITIETIPPHPALSRAAWIEGMAGWRAPFDAFRLKFKIVGIDLLEGEARTEARVEVFGRRGETRIGIVGTTRLHWIGPPWRIRTIEVDPLERSIVRGQAMTDITAAALSPAPEAVAQFSRGLDTWRGLLDEATGIDVYGHHGLAVGDLDNDGFDDLYVLQPGG